MIRMLMQQYVQVLFWVVIFYYIPNYIHTYDYNHIWGGQKHNISDIFS